MGMRITPFSDQRSRFLAGKLGMGIFLVSLGMLFAVSLIGFLVIRIQLTERGAWPVDLPPLPGALWISTLTLIVSSLTVQWALNGIRAGRLDQLKWGMVLTILLGYGFLALQSICWLKWLEPVSQRWDESAEARYALTSFYVLTGLHALHVIGGLIPMTIVTRKALAKAYSVDYFPGVHYSAMYWHFLDAVWVVLFLALMLGI